MKDVNTVFWKFNFWHCHELVRSDHYFLWIAGQTGSGHKFGSQVGSRHINESWTLLVSAWLMQVKLQVIFAGNLFCCISIWAKGLPLMHNHVCRMQFAMVTCLTVACEVLRLNPTVDSYVWLSVAQVAAVCDAYILCSIHIRQYEYWDDVYYEMWSVASAVATGDWALLHLHNTWTLQNGWSRQQLN